MLSKCGVRSASAPAELAGNPRAWGLRTREEAGPGSPGAGQGEAGVPGSEGESRCRAAGVRAPHLEVVRVREAQGPESFEVGGTWAAAGLRRSPAGDLGRESPSPCASLRPPVCEVGAGGSTSPVSCQRPRSTWPEPGHLPPARPHSWDLHPARGWEQGEAAPRGRPDRREVTVEAFVLSSPVWLGNLTLGFDLGVPGSATGCEGECGP